MHPKLPTLNPESKPHTPNQVMRSSYVTGFSVGLQPQALGQNVPQEVFVYYREGAHAAAPFNMSEWRVLGTVLVHPRP